MEKESDSEYYLPFPPARLTSFKEFLKETAELPGNYKSPNKPNNFLVKFISELNDFSEGIIEPAVILDQRDIFYFPPKWRFLAEYLQKKSILKSIFFEPLLNDEPKFFRLALQTPMNDSLTDGMKLKHKSFSHGDSVDFEEAIAKAFGEFLERYPLTIYREKNLLKSSMSTMRKKKRLFFNINQLAGFSDKQKEKSPSLNFNEKSQFLWAKGKNLLNNQTVFIPAQLVFWNYNLYHKDWQEPILRERNTNGAGGHCTLTEAILSGLYELIQRDGFLIYWLNHQPASQIDQATIKSDKTHSLIEQCRQLGMEIYFFNTTSEIGVPACICTISECSGVGPRISVGGGCGTDWEKILLRSLTEALSVYHWLYKKHRDAKDEYFFIDEKNLKPFSDSAIGQVERLSFWGNVKSFEHFSFFLEEEKQSLNEIIQQFPKFNSPEEELENLIEKFKKMGKGYEIYYYQAKNKILDDLGYYSVKVIVPQLIQLYLNEINAPLGASRFRNAPKKMGFEPAKEFNPWPHPFP